MSTTNTTSDSKHAAQEFEIPSLGSKGKTGESHEAIATKQEGAKGGEEHGCKMVKAASDAKDEEPMEEENVDERAWRDATPEEVVWSKAAAAADFLPEGVKDEGEYPLPSRSWGWKREREPVSEEEARASRAAAKADFLPAGVVDEGEGPTPSRRQGWKGFDAASKAKLLAKLQGSGEGERDAEVGDQQS